jgi:hypothetical protein
LYEFISCLTTKFSTGPGARADTGEFGNILGVITSAGTEVSRGVNKRYGDTALYKSLFSDRKLVHAICLWAFTGTWDLDISGLFQQQVDEMPVETMGALTTCQRTFISYDPTTQPSGLTTWAYRIAGGMIAGADLNYRLKLKCSTGFQCDPSDYPDGKCDCQTTEQTLPVASPDLGTGIAKKFQVVNFDSPFVVNPQQDPIGASYRYDTAILEWDWTDPQTKQRRNSQQTCRIRETEGGSAPVFCGLDLFSGKFRCIFGEAESGIRILNTAPNYQPNQTAFGLGQNLSFNIDVKQVLPPERARQQNAKKFLTYDIKDGTGQTVFGLLTDGTTSALRTTPEATDLQYELSTDGTYRITIPFAEKPDATPLSKFKLNEQTLQRHGGTGITGPSLIQRTWSPGLSLPKTDFVTKIELTNNKGERYPQEKWFVIVFPDLTASPGKEQYEVRLLDPNIKKELLATLQPKPNNGWIDFAPRVLHSGTQTEGRPAETVPITIEEPALLQSPISYSGSLEFRHVSTTDYPSARSLQILVKYVPPTTPTSKPLGACSDPTKPVQWLAEIRIYDADLQGYPNPNQLSSDPESGEPQQKTTPFLVQCATEQDLKALTAQEVKVTVPATQALSEALKQLIAIEQQLITTLPSLSPWDANNNIRQEWREKPAEKAIILKTALEAFNTSTTAQTNTLKTEWNNLSKTDRDKLPQIIIENEVVSTEDFLQKTNNLTTKINDFIGSITQGATVTVPPEINNAVTELTNALKTAKAKQEQELQKLQTPSTQTK